MNNNETSAALTLLLGILIALSALGTDLYVPALPDVAASAEELMQAADKAMYRVKDAGKNGIQAASASEENA